MKHTKAETARWMGYGDNVAAMDMEHDSLHGALCHFLGVASYALKDARGENMTDRERELASYEEDAVLAVQRLRQMHRVAHG